MTLSVDAAIVGGGPAGSATAIALARTGRRIALIERGPRHRNKCCGHCVNPRALQELRRLGLLKGALQLAEVATQRFRAHRSGNDGCRTLDAPLNGSKGDDCGRVIERSGLDQFLMDAAAAAGAIVIQPASARVRSITRDRVTIQINQHDAVSEIDAELLIGADGVGSAVARAAGLADARAAGRKFAFAFDWFSECADAIEPGAIEMFISDRGYLGVVRCGEQRLHIAGMIQPPSAQHEPHDRDPMMFVRSIATQHDSLCRLGLDQFQRDRMEQFSAIGPMPWRPHAIATGRVALVGDASGYIEPFTGEGIAWALRSAAILADVIVKQAGGSQAAHGIWHQQAVSIYQRRWKREISRRQIACRAIGCALRRPNVTAWGMRAAARFPFFTHQLVRKAVTA